MPRTPNQHTITVMRTLGYRYHANPATRPHCDSCGPFRSAFLRPVGDGEVRCSGCDEENES